MPRYMIEVRKAYGRTVYVVTVDGDGVVARCDKQGDAYLIAMLLEKHVRFTTAD